MVSWPNSKHLRSRGRRSDKGAHMAGRGRSLELGLVDLLQRELLLAIQRLVQDPHLRARGLRSVPFSSFFCAPNRSQLFSLPTKSDLGWVALVLRNARLNNSLLS